MSKHYAPKGRDGARVRRLSAQRRVKSASSLDLIKVADLLKLSALTGFLLYVALFLGYYRYYQVLGLRPEDVGVSNTYILVRSTGFVAFMVILFGLLAVIYWQNSKIKRSQFKCSQSSAWVNFLRWVIVYLAAILLGLFTIFLTPPDWPNWADWIVFGVIYLIIFLAFLFAHRKRLERWVVFVVPALLLTVLLPATSVAARANDLAHQVLAGRQVSPWQIVNIPILDVSAKHVDVTWIGPKSQRPAVFGENSPKSINGLLLGDGPGTVLILIRDNQKLCVVRLPSSLVMVESS